LFLLGFFCFLYRLSRTGKYKLAAYIFLLGYLFPICYSLYVWGADLPQATLTCILIIVMSGILINSKFAFVSSIVISLYIVVLTYLQTNSILQLKSYWRQELFDMGDSIVASVTFIIIATVSWLSNREIEKSLKRAHKSEAALKKERESLEIKVEERTKELKLAQMEKVAQIYRFAEFGKLSSGLFHDLVNPLTALSLNLEQLKSQKTSDYTTAHQYLEQALVTTKRMGKFIEGMKKQIQKQEASESFSLTGEIDQAIQILAHKARKTDVKIRFKPERDIQIHGNPAAFNQLVVNLLSNAIDACETQDDPDRRKVSITLSKKNSWLTLAMKDGGCGIPKENLDRIFDPFFTTKSIQKGTGIGLSTCKKIIEESLKGTVKVESEKGRGTTFTITFPYKNRLDAHMARDEKNNHP